ncbi:hypothetical protein ACVW2K_001827 [Nocardioides sp. HB32]
MRDRVRRASRSQLPAKDQQRSAHTLPVDWFATGPAELRSSGTASAEADRARIPPHRVRAPSNKTGAMAASDHGAVSYEAYPPVATGPSTSSTGSGVEQPTTNAVATPQAERRPGARAASTHAPNVSAAGHNRTHTSPAAGVRADETTSPRIPERSPSSPSSTKLAAGATAKAHLRTRCSDGASSAGSSKATPANSNIPIPDSSAARPTGDHGSPGTRKSYLWSCSGRHPPSSNCPHLHSGHQRCQAAA